MITPKQQQVLADIFGNTERLDKITVRMDPVSRTVTVVYEDMDEEWFNELTDAGHAQARQRR